MTGGVGNKLKRKVSRKVGQGKKCMPRKRAREMMGMKEESGGRCAILYNKSLT